MRIAAMLMLGLLAMLIAPVSDAATAGTAVRYEMGEPVFSGRSWTFSPRAYDADGSDVGFAGANVIYVDVPPGTNASNNPGLERTVIGLGPGANVGKMILMPGSAPPSFDTTFAILDVSFDLNGAPGAPSAA